MRIIGRRVLMMIALLGWFTHSGYTQSRPIESGHTLAQLVLGEGFNQGEQVAIKIEYAGKDTVVFSGKLDRPLCTQDNSFFHFPMPMGKVFKLIVNCQERAVRFEQEFRFSGTLAVYIQVTLRNQFSVLCSDREFEKFD